MANWKSFHLESAQDFMIKYLENDTYVDFKVYEIAGEEYFSPTKSEFIYIKIGATSSNDTTKLFEEAEIFLEGHIKWDGCSNFHFTKDCYHTCSKKQAESLGTLMTKLYELTAKEINMREE